MVASNRHCANMVLVSGPSGVVGSVMASANSNRPSRVGFFVAFRVVIRYGRRPRNRRRTTTRIAAYDSHATTTALTNRTKDTAHGGAKESAFLNALNSDCRFCMRSGHMLLNITGNEIGRASCRERV